ncbi:hypothetical protein M5K25_008109 [Dendrobium thyrsiflorum]|uniref:Uncharacterized protein n=1 Tax=Dendrobium thyrsiflorum TaxID=117978 RepID=A0ABD0V7K8_DENTH
MTLIKLLSRHEKIEGKFFILDEMLKKLFKGQQKTALSEAREAAGNQENEKNPNPIRRKEDQECSLHSAKEAKGWSCSIFGQARRITCRFRPSKEKKPVDFDQEEEEFPYFSQQGERCCIFQPSKNGTVSGHSRLALYISHLKHSKNGSLWRDAAKV